MTVRHQIEQSPSHTFTTAGTYNVVLTASDSNGGSSTKQTTITVNQAPVTLAADFTASTTTGNAPLNVQFTDKSTGASSLSWNFGDGLTSNQQSPSHTFSTAGTYTVVLTASDSNGGSSTKQTTITVTGTPVILTADFTASTTTGNAPLNVQFTDTSTGSPTSWFWNFGDGQTSNQQSPSHTFSTAGTYNVVLTVSDSNNQYRKQMTITVNAPSSTAPVAAFTATPTYGTSPLTVQFTDQSTNTPTSWTWDFNNDGIVDSYEQNPSYAYSTAGTYTVKLTATNSGGTDDEVKSGYIVVSNPLLTPVQEIRQMTATVQSLVISGVLTKNDGNKLISKLDTAIKYLDARQANRAIKELNAFITQVEVDVQRGKLSSTQGQALVDEANSVINVL